MQFITFNFACFAETYFIYSFSFPLSSFSFTFPPLFSHLFMSIPLPAPNKYTEVTTYFPIFKLHRKQKQTHRHRQVPPYLSWAAEEGVRIPDAVRDLHGSGHGWQL
jgi:hypothetical protein